MVVWRGVAPCTDMRTCSIICAPPTSGNTQFNGYNAQGVRLTGPDTGGANTVEEVRRSVLETIPHHATKQIDGTTLNC